MTDEHTNTISHVEEIYRRLEALRVSVVNINKIIDEIIAQASAASNTQHELALRVATLEAARPAVPAPGPLTTIAPTASLAELSVLESRVASLEDMLLGDQEELRRYNDGLARNTHPRPLERPVGMIETLQTNYDGVAKVLEELRSKIAPFLGGAIDGKDVATTSYVDRALERHGEALRREWERAIDAMAHTIWKKVETAHAGFEPTIKAIEERMRRAIAMADAFRARVSRLTRISVDAVDDMLPSHVFMVWADRLADVILDHEARQQNEQAAAAERAARPSRLELLRSIISGQPPRTNHHRGYR